MRTHISHLWLLPIAGLLLSGCAGLGGTAAAPTATPDAAPPPARVVADGKILPARSADLRFLGPGLVGEIMVAEGDHVAEGAPLARLDSAELELNAEHARAALTQAQAAYEQLAAGAAPDTIAAAEASLAQAQAGARQVVGSVSPSDLAAARADLAQARAAQAQLQAGPKADAIKQARAALAQAQADLQSQRDALAAAKGAADLGVQQAANALRDAQDAYSRTYWDNRKAEGQPGDLSQTQKDAEESARRTVQNAEAALAQARLDLEQARQAEVSGIASATARVGQAQASLDLLLTGADADQIAGARARVAAAEAALARLTGDARSGAVDAADAAVQQAQANLSQLKAGPRSVDLAVAKAQVQAAAVAVRQAELAIERATLRAPFAGTVVAIHLKAGELTPAEPAIVIAETSAWKIETSDLTELDIVAVNLGDQVTLSFDALPDLTLQGIVTDIKGLGSTYQGDVIYTVVVKPSGWDPRLRWNMTATVTIGA
jgi:HlyD family secretion protein